MKILVTGGAGFIGSHLVDRLVEKEEVIVIDNLSRGKKENINPKAKFINGEIRDLKIFESLPKDINTTFHLAALTNARESLVRPDLFFDVNVNGSFNVLEFCRKTDSKIIFISSAAVYGDYNRPVTEADVCKPLSPYGHYKIVGEELTKSYNEYYGLQYIIFRLFNAYGPRANDGVIKILMDCIRNKKTFYLYGDGKQKRDFVHVSDVVKILTQYSKFKNKIVNIGGGKPFTILEILKTIENLSGKKVEIVSKDPIKGEIDFSCANNNSLLSEFNFNFTPLDVGIKRTIENS